MQNKSPTMTSRAVGAGAWTVGTRLISKVIDLVLLLCLARFLGPEEFGVIAVAMAVVLIIEALFEMPIAAALMRVPLLNVEMLQTAFTISCLRGIIIAVLLVAVSLPLAAFTNESKLIVLLPALALAPIARGLVSPRMVEYARVFNFRPDALLELSGKIFAFCSAISVAYIYRSYWAIAAATILGPIVSTILSYFVAPLKPKFTLVKWKLFSNLIGWNFVSQLCSALNWQIDRLLLPRLTTASGFGQYAMSKQISEIPIQALIQPLIRPTMAALTSAGENKTSRYLQLSHGVVLVMAPVLGVFAIWSEVVVRIALGPSWLPAAEWLKWLSAIWMIDLPAILMGPLAMTLDRTRWIAVRAFLELIVRMPLVWNGAVYFGIAGAVGGGAIATVFVSLVGLMIVKRLANITILKQVNNIITPFAALVPAGALLYFTQPLVMSSASLPEIIGVAAVIGVGYMVIYILVVLFAWWLKDMPAGLERHLMETVKLRIFGDRKPRFFPKPDSVNSK